MKTQLLRILGVFMGISLHLSVIGQVTNVPSSIESNQSVAPAERCGSDALHQYMLKYNPEYREKTEELERFTASYKKDKAGGVVYKIPVVVHVLSHTGPDPLGAELAAVTDEQIQNAVRTVNQQFRKLTGSPWVGTTARAADTEIELVLAVRDPAGNCTNGITRHNVSAITPTGTLTAAQITAYGNAGQGTGGMTDANVKSIGRWYTAAPRRYYEIWLVTEINNSNAGSGVKGYATGSGSHNTATDGSVMEGRDFLDPNSITFAHEMAHSLNVAHTFAGDLDNGTCPSSADNIGNPNLGTPTGDGCADTPRHNRDASGFSPCDPGGMTCGGLPKTGHLYNYMDYSMCTMNEFSIDQVARMSAVMDPAAGARRSLLAGAPNNNMSLVPPTVAGVAAFISDKTVMCSGEEIQFYDKTLCIPNNYLNQEDVNSANFPGITYAWTVTNATNPAETYSSNRINPSFSPTGTGRYNVTLNITVTSIGGSPAGTKSVTVNNAFYIAPTPTAAAVTPRMTTNASGNFRQTVSRVTFNTIDNSTSAITNMGTSGYQNLTCSKNTKVTAGDVHVLSVTANSGGSGAQGVRVDIDWNNDGVFSGAGEINLLTGSTPNPGSQTFTTNITIPTPVAAAKDKLLRMRVMTDAGGVTANKVAGTQSYNIGEVEDYGIYIATPPPAGCAPSVTSDPVATATCENGNASFTVVAAQGTPPAAINYAWEVSTDGGGTWNPVVDGGIYSNATTATLNITGAPLANNSFQYRASITAVGCSDPAVTSVGAILTVNAAPAVPVITGNGSPYCSPATATLSAPAGATSYLWDDGAATTTQTLAVSTSGIFTVTVTNAAGCPATSAASTVVINTTPIISSGTTSGPTTCGGADGSIQVNGPGSGTLNISGPAGYTANYTGALPHTFPGLGDGAYTIDFTDGTSFCAATPIVVTISDPANPPMPVISTVDMVPFCQGGSATLTSDPAASYLWNDGAATTTQNLVVTAAGSYSVTITDANNCSATSNPFTVAVNSNPVIAIGNTNNPSACTLTDGNIEVTLTSGNADGTIFVTGSATQTIPTSNVFPQVISSLGAGSYTIDYTDVNGCVSGTFTQTLSDPAAPATPIISTTDADEFCAGGSASLNSDVATGIEWFLNGVTTGQITTPLVATADGDYTVKVTDVSGCSAISAPFTITVNALPTPIITASGPLSFCAGGDVDLSSDQVDPGNEWSTTETTQTITVNTTGDYTVTYTDVNGCVGTSAITHVDVLPAPVIDTVTTNPTVCLGTDGTIQVTGTATGDLTITGPGGPYNMVGITLPQTQSALTAGVYTISFNDGTCPSNTIVATLSDPAGPPAPTITTSNGTNSYCAGSTLDLTSSEVGGNTWSTGATTDMITINTPGTYTVSITVAGCTSTTPITITENALPTVTITPSGSTTFCGGGSVDLVSTAGASYLWTPNGETTQTITATAAGTYDVTVTDVNGCSATSAGVTVVVNPTPVITNDGFTDPTVCGASDGTITIGGTGTGDITWSGSTNGSETGVTLPFTLTSTFAAGLYSFVFDDGTGCPSDPISQAYNDPGGPAQPIITPSGSTTICTGDNVTLTSSTASAYKWQDNTTGQSLVASTSGFYFVLITETGCSSVSDAVEVVVNILPPAPIITPSGSTTFCEGGSVTLSSSVATGYLWNDAATTTTQDLVVTADGTYNVTITDANGCKSTSADEVVVVNPIPVITIAGFTDPTTCGGTDGTITVGGTGTGNIFYSGVTSGSVLAATLPATIPGLGVGTYTIDFTDNNGCDAVAITQALSNPPAPAAPTVTPGGPTTFCAGGSVVLTASAGASYLWSNGQTTQSITVNANGSYDVVITNAAGCTSPSSASTTVTVNPTPPTPVITAGGPVTFCNGGSVTLNSSSATGNIWSPTNETTQSIVANASGTYSVVVTELGCPSAPSNSILVVESGAPVITIGTNNPAVSCAGTKGSVVINGTGTGTINYTGATTGSVTVASFPRTITGLNPGVNTFVFVSSTGCTSNPVSATINDIPAPATPTISAISATTFCDGGSVVLTSSVTTGITWAITGETSSSITVSSSGTYFVTSSNGAGCTRTSNSIVVTENVVPAITIDAATIIQPAGCAGSTGSFVVDGTIGISGVLTWDNGVDPASSLSTALPYTVVTGPGLYNVSYKNGSCISNILQVELENTTALPDPVIQMSGPTTFCDGGSVTLSGPAGADTYLWFSNTQPGANGQSVTINANDTVYLKITKGPCEYFSTDTIVVREVATPTVSIVYNSPVCVNDTLVIYGTTLTGFTYSWTLNGTPILPPTTNVLMYPSAQTSNSGTYQMIAGTGGCTAKSNTLNVVVNPLPSVAFGQMDPICKNYAPIQLVKGTPAGGEYSGTGVITPGNQNFDPNLAGVGVHTLTYKFTNGNGCVGTATSPIEVKGCAGVDEEALLTVSLFPNPSNGNVTIEVGDATIENVVVFDNLGKLVHVMNDSAVSNVEMNLNQLADGVYTLEVTTDLGIVRKQLMIKK